MELLLFILQVQKKIYHNFIFSMYLTFLYIQRLKLILREGAVLHDNSFVQEK